MKTPSELKKLNQRYAKFNVKQFVQDGYTKTEILQLKEAFDLFDLNKKGILNLNDFKKSLNEMGMLSKNQQIDRLINDGIETINFPKFVELMGAKKSCKTDEDVKKLYMIFLNDPEATTCDKKLSVDDFKRVAEDLELELAPDEIDEMINCVQPEEEGFLSYEEFYNIMMKVK